MITDCICPECGKTTLPRYYEDVCEEEIYEDDTYYIEYFIHCSCGCKYTYTEWYKLSDTEIKKFNDFE